MNIDVTGLYENGIVIEAWAVHRKTQEKACLGGIEKRIAIQYPEAYRLWQRDVWLLLLTHFGGLSEETADKLRG